MSEKAYDQMVTEGLRAYKEATREEVKGRAYLTSDMLNEDVKRAMGLDVLPVEIQNDILELGQKLVDYALEVAQGEEEKGIGHHGWSGPSYPSPAATQRWMSCVGQMPMQSIWNESLSVAGKTAGSLGMTGGWYKPFQPYIPILGAASGLANVASSMGGWMIGCATR